MTLPFAANFLVSSDPVEEILEEIFDPMFEENAEPENPEPSLPPEATDAPDELIVGFLDVHGAWKVGDMGDLTGDVGLVPLMGECMRANRSALSFSVCFFSSFCICFSATLRERAPLLAIRSNIKLCRFGCAPGGGISTTCGLLSMCSESIDSETVTQISGLPGFWAVSLERLAAGWYAGGLRTVSYMTGSCIKAFEFRLELRKLGWFGILREVDSSLNCSQVQV